MSLTSVFTLFPLCVLYIERRNLLANYERFVHYWNIFKAWMAANWFVVNINCEMNPIFFYRQLIKYQIFVSIWGRIYLETGRIRKKPISFKGTCVLEKKINTRYSQFHLLQEVLSCMANSSLQGKADEMFQDNTTIDLICIASGRE